MNILQVVSENNSYQNPQFYNAGFEKHDLSDKLTLHQFDYVSQVNVVLNLKAKNNSSIYFIVNLDTNSLSGLYFQDRSVTVPALGNCMLYLEKNKTLVFKSQKKLKYNFLILQIDSSHFGSDQKSFLDRMWHNKCIAAKFDKGQMMVPNLMLFETSNHLKLLNKNSYSNKFMALGYANILIGQKIEELVKSEVCVFQGANFRHLEIEQLQKITSKIEQNPELQYSINDLCKASGLSVSKLQLGFKHMHNCTVANFIRNVRLDKAIELLHDSDLNVSEIVYSVGLSSRSYFCRVFKKRFKCTPKAYQQQLKMGQAIAS